MSIAFTPEKVASYSITTVEDMPKISDAQTRTKYNTIDAFQHKIDENLLAIPSSTGDLNFLGLSVGLAESLRISRGPVFVLPPNPGDKPTNQSLFAQTTAPQKLAYPFLIQESTRLFNQCKLEFENTQLPKLSSVK